MVCFKVLCLKVSVDGEKPWINGSGQSIFEVRYDSGTDETPRGLANRRTPGRLYTPLLLRLTDILILHCFLYQILYFGRSDWARQWMWWEYLRDYFPLRLEKTVDLDPSNTYIFCVFPHGVLSVGAFTSFATDANNVRSLFPGLRPYLVTLAGHFITPFIRELSLALGKHEGGKSIFRRTCFIMCVCRIAKSDY